MGRVVAEAVFENAVDLGNVKAGTLAPEKVRRVVVKDALVDSGATYCCMPKSMILALGFAEPSDFVVVNTARGRTKAGIYGPVLVRILDRVFHGDIMEVAEGCPV